MKNIFLHRAFCKAAVWGAAAMMTLSLAACSKSDNDNGAAGGSTAAQGNTTVQMTAAQNGMTQQTTSAQDVTSSQTDAADKETSQTGGSTQDNAAQLLKDVHDAIKKEFGDDYAPNMAFDEDYISDVYGITPDMYDEFIAEGPMISVVIDMFIAFKAKDGMAQDIYDKMFAYQDYLINESMQYPTNAVKVQASRLVQHGDYIFFVCLGSIDMAVEEKGDEAILAQAQGKNQKAVDVIDSFFDGSR